MQIQGPRSRDLVRSLTDADVDALRYFRFFPEPVRLGGSPVWLSRTGFSGELGYEVFLRPQHAAAVWEAVAAAGATPYGADVIEPIRVEAGMIVTDYDYEPHERTPYDLGLDRFVALHDLNMGTEALRAIAQVPPNRFRTIRLEGDRLSAYGADVSIGGRPVGVLTSPAVSPRYGAIGLAIVETAAADVGTRVEVSADDGSLTGTIDVLAIHDPNKERPRG
jgi:aminomethyltransferase